MRHHADLQTLSYMLAASVLFCWQWQAQSLMPVLYLLTLLLAFAVGIMHHNHCHVPMWRSHALNRLTDCWFTLLMGHPGFVFALCHERNHHRHRNRQPDWTRTWRVRDDNSLSGFIRHPFESAITLRPHIAAYLRAVRAEAASSSSPSLWPSPWPSSWLSLWHWICAQYLLLALAVGTAFVLDPLKALLFVVIPQLTALFFLLGANYLQHAHSDELSDAAHSRNFVGLVNPLFFNIGYHSAHHLRARAHWSELPAIHARIAHSLDARMVESSLLWYCLRVFVLSALVPRWRSRPLRQASGHAGTRRGDAHAQAVHGRSAKEGSAKEGSANKDSANQHSANEYGANQHSAQPLQAPTG